MDQVLANLSLWSICFTLLSIAMFFAGISILYRTVYARLRFVNVSGVISHLGQGGSRGFSSRPVTVKFVDKEGKELEVKTTFSAFALNTIGQKVDILYNPADHRDIVIKTWTRYWLGLGLMVLSLPLVVNFLLTVFK